MLQLESYFIHINGNTLHYTQIGKGKKILLAFSGFGQNQAHFHKLAEVLTSEYTVYAFDTFFHGKSIWKDCEKTLSADEWKKFADIFLTRHHIHQFAILGYSLGGKFALTTLSLFPDQVVKLILIAPDGVKTSIWYSLATYPYWIRRIFRSTVTQPGRFFLLVRVLSKLHLLEKGVAKFAKSQMNNQKKRYRVYCTWIVLRKLRPDIKKIAGLINQRSIEVEMFLGSYDRIIRQKNMKKLLKKLKDYRLIILEKGHNTLIDDVADYYQK